MRSCQNKKPPAQAIPEKKNYANWKWNLIECENICIFYLRFFAGEHSPCTFDFDGTGGALAHAFFPENGEIHFDDAERFTDGVATGTNFFSVALHEIGHALGLKHTQRQNAIMHAQYKPYDPNMNVTDDEKHGIQYIYGKYISGLEVYSSENSQWKVTGQ